MWYRPPPSMRNSLKTREFLADYDELVKELSASSSKVLLLGDFNIHVDIPSKPEAMEFLSSLDEAGLCQHIQGPTHRCGHTLDLIISKDNDDSFVNSCWIREKLYSDHHFLGCVLDVARPKLQNVTSVSRNFRSLNKDSLCSKIAEAFVDFPFQGTADEHVTFYNNAIFTVLDTMCPATKRTHKFRSHPPWYSDEIYEARRTRRRLEKVWSKNRTTDNRHKYLNQIHMIDKLVKQAKSSFYNDQLSDADAKKIYGALNVLLDRSPKILPVHASDQDLSNRFATYFSSKVSLIREALLSVSPSTDPTPPVSEDLHPGHVGENPAASGGELSAFVSASADTVRKIIMSSPSKSCSLDPFPVWLVKENIDTFLPYIVSIVETSLNSGQFPSPLKDAVVTPLTKKPTLDRDDLKNYRPVSNLPLFLSKVIEKTALSQLSEHL
ncbi:uncharacterized protein LOC121421284 [Lytechinus variegatus]|uniref:uncharacterized protein LOC121421284 n=1 Tax=Lytechinus variegatus TaxID=7654 RepID=UPI001BB235ED|nr:uncharacterized protein LOC121421284 [Lytechinus variegatus]